jgi:glycosyltransferase involved in cell wall biosynthesis
VLGFSDLQQEYYPQFFTEVELERRTNIYKPSTEKALHIIVPSQYTKNTLIDKYATPSEKITIIPHGISSIFRRASPNEIHRIRLQYNLPDRYIFFPANPWPHKNHSRLMAALRIYQYRYDDPMGLVLSGRLNNEPRDATTLAIAAGVDNRVIDLGFVLQEDLPALYSSAALMVFPSLFEGFGYPLVEAMACGCPIVAANTTSIPEITNGAALLFDPFDPEAIANAIHRLINDSALCTELVEQGYRQIFRFDWKAIVPQLVSVYANTIG